jgi:hypothetical protein
VPIFIKSSSLMGVAHLSKMAHITKRTALGIGGQDVKALPGERALLAMAEP